MSKPLFFISCPIDTYSGYGARSRDLVRAIIATDKYDVKIIPQMWGNTPWNFISDNPEWGFLSQHIWAQPQLPKHIKRQNSRENGSITQDQHARSIPSSSNLRNIRIQHHLRTG